MWVQLSPTAALKGNIPYQRNRPLTYADFHAKPSHPNALAIAVTQTGTCVKFKTVTRGLRTEGVVTVFVEMDPEESWMKAEGKNAATLRHKQLHFDITALWACKLKGALDSTRFELSRYQHQIESIQKEYEVLCWDEQKRYDQETDPGRTQPVRAPYPASTVERKTPYGIKIKLQTFSREKAF